jgi:hypothetical protein
MGTGEARNHFGEVVLLDAVSARYVGNRQQRIVAQAEMDQRT